MFQRIMRMLSKRSMEFVIIFFFQTAVFFAWKPLFVFNAACVTILCVLYIPLVTFIVPTLPMWYKNKIGNLPKLDVLQFVLCASYAASAWAPILWEIG